MKAATSLFFCLFVFGGIEYAFNVFPATSFSSAVLQACHFVLVIGLWFSDIPPMSVSARTGKEGCMRRMRFKMDDT